MDTPGRKAAPASQGSTLEEVPTPLPPRLQGDRELQLCRTLWVSVKVVVFGDELRYFTTYDKAFIFDQACGYR